MYKSDHIFTGFVFVRFLQHRSANDSRRRVREREAEGQGNSHYIVHDGPVHAYQMQQGLRESEIVEMRLDTRAKTRKL